MEVCVIGAEAAAARRAGAFRIVLAKPALHGSLLLLQVLKIVAENVGCAAANLARVIRP